MYNFFLSQSHKSILPVFSFIISRFVSLRPLIFFVYNVRQVSKWIFLPAVSEFSSYSLWQSHILPRCCGHRLWHPPAPRRAGASLSPLPARWALCPSLTWSRSMSSKLGRKAPLGIFIFRINLPIPGPLLLHLILEGFFFFGQILQRKNNFCWRFDCNCNLLRKRGLIGFLQPLGTPP